MLLESLAAELRRRGGASIWPLLVPGVSLALFGLRLSAGAPLLRG